MTRLSAILGVLPVALAFATDAQLPQQGNESGVVADRVVRLELYGEVAAHWAAKSHRGAAANVSMVGIIAQRYPDGSLRVVHTSTEWKGQTLLTLSAVVRPDDVSDEGVVELRNFDECLIRVGNLTEEKGELTPAAFPDNSRAGQTAFTAIEDLLRGIFGTD